MKKEKYELTDEWRKGFDGEKVFRIIAMRDIPVHDVTKGDMGGFVSGYGNLSQTGDSWVADEAIVEGEAYVCGDAWVAGKARVHGKSRIEERAYVYRSARVGNSKIKGDCEVFGTAIVNSSTLEGNITVKNKAELMACRLYGKILVINEAFAIETVVRGTDIFLLGKTVIKKSTIGVGGKGNTRAVSIGGESSLEGVSIFGDDISVEDHATLQTGANLKGANIRIADYALISGNVRILSNTDVKDFVQLQNDDLAVNHRHEYGDVVLQGDLVID